MATLWSLIILTFFHTYHCDTTINNLFGTINRTTLTFNQVAAEIAWESSVNTGNIGLNIKAANYQKNQIIWQQSTCDKLATLFHNHLLNNNQERQTYLLCRGPKYTFEEARPPRQPGGAPTGTPRSREARVWCPWPGPLCATKGEVDFDNLIASSREEEVLRWLWLVWREKTGMIMKEPYRRLIDIENVAARRNGYQNIGVSWRDELEIPNLRAFCRSIYESIRPFYTLLHGVVRFHLRLFYGNVVPEIGPIPAHLLGNLWSQNWEHLSDLLIEDDINLNLKIKNLNWSVTHMVKRAEDYYQSMGLPAMTDAFWRESVFARENNAAKCHGAAADMFKDGEFRLLYCSGTSKEDFYVIHHELGHIQYYMAYKNQTTLFRQANTALHESIGDTIMYGVMTPQHLHRLGLITDSQLYSTDTRDKYIERDLTANLISREVKLDSKFKEFEFGKNADSNDINNMNLESRFNQFKGESYFGDRRGWQYMSRNRRKHFNLERELKMTELDHILKKLNKNSKSFHRYSNLFDNKPDTQLKKRSLFKNSEMNFQSNLHTNSNNRIQASIPTSDVKMKLSTDEILLLKQALNKIPQIPFSLLIDEYRWKYFEGSLKNPNDDFWKLSLELQGISPPDKRGEEYFDAGAKFHVPDNTPFIRYFLSSFLQHQLFEYLCKTAVFGRRDVKEPLPETIALNNCDLYGSKAVGKVLRDIMSKGHSQHWKEILKSTINVTDISSTALMRYYRPLQRILLEHIQKYKIPIGW
ncbi:hypothetical protein K1T71_014238 [Dendrolimus kikuchii]|uniref:Uncharacterized protein n=1 Tax=Dendrolimus kikuchii TaxID=765133 RepID=A0ACC1CFC8_9NEOP|nr:hypothetical protein K1T71_014238 [Dendrolimus kikuchii]